MLKSSARVDPNNVINTIHHQDIWHFYFQAWDVWNDG
jgi:hypothetical protein